MPKVPDWCPVCDMDTYPTDTPIYVTVRWQDKAVPMWRYVCPVCKYIWTTLAQREHNVRLINRLFAKL